MSPLDTEGLEPVRDLPPSAKFVATMLPGRTVRHALDRLDEVGAVASRPAYIDARKRIYRLADDRAEP